MNKASISTCGDQFINVATRKRTEMQTHTLVAEKDSKKAGLQTGNRKVVWANK